MVNNKYLSDILFCYKIDCYHGHKVVLYAGSELFRQIFEIGREVDAVESVSERISLYKKKLSVTNRQCIDSGTVTALRNIYDM